MMSKLEIFTMIGCITFLVILFSLYFRAIGRTTRARNKPLENKDFKEIQPFEQALILSEYFERGFIRTRIDLEELRYFWGDLPIPADLDRDRVEAILVCVRLLDGTQIMIRGGHANVGEIIPFMRSMFSHPERTDVE